MQAPASRRRGRPPADAAVLSVDRIVDAALRTLESSPGECSMRGIAATLGVDPMALYHHVDGKQALLDAVLARTFRALDRLPSRFARMPDPLDRLHALALCYLRCVAPVPQLTRQLARGPASPAHRQFDRAFEAALGCEVGPGSVQGVARDLLVDFLHGAALAGRKEAEAALRRAWPLLARALGPACGVPAVSDRSRPAS